MEGDKKTKTITVSIMLKNTCYLSSFSWTGVVAEPGKYTDDRGEGDNKTKMMTVSIMLKNTFYLPNPLGQV